MPQYVTQEELNERMSNFTGFVSHVIAEAKSDLRKEIMASEQRLESKINQVRDELMTEMKEFREEVQEELRELRKETNLAFKDFRDRIEGIEKRQAADRQMMQTILEVVSNIQSKLSN